MLNFGGVSDLLLWPAKFSKNTKPHGKIQPVAARFFKDFVSSDQAHEFSILGSRGDAETIRNFQSGPPGSSYK